MSDTNGNGVTEKPPVRPLAIHCYAAFSDGCIRGLWIDMDRNVIHIEHTPLSQVPKDMMQILDPGSRNLIETAASDVPKTSENLKEANRLTEEANVSELSGNRNDRRNRKDRNAERSE
jgi:hypothetical protein